MRSRRSDKHRTRQIFLTQVKLPLIIILALLFLPTSFAFADYLAHYQKIHKGVYISNNHLGGLTPAQAENKLQAFKSKALKEPFLIVYKDKSWELIPEQIVSSANIKESIKIAFNVGRQGNPFKQLTDRLFLWKRPKRLSLQYSLNESELKAFLQKIKAQSEIQTINARIEIEKGKAYLIPSRSGREIREKALLQLITQKVLKPTDRRIDLPITHLSPHLTTKEAKTAFEEAKIMLSAPVVVGLKNHSWTIEPVEIGKLITFKEKRERGTGSRVVHQLHAHLNPKSTDTFFKSLAKDISKPPKDATFEVSGNKVKIVPSRDGFQVDIPSFIPELEETLGRKHYRRTKITMATVKPKLTTEMAASMGIKEHISTFTTHFNPRATSRVHNIRLLSRSLDGKTVAPGEIFSFNGAIGPRTAAKGYKEAPTIINGELVPTYGGGVCQVGTTFFNTIFFGGYEIVERHNHSFYISHYPTGRDATVSYGGYDLKFKNDTPYHLLIKTASTKSSLTISIYSTDTGREVTFTTSPFSGFKPFENKYEPDPSLPKDTQVVKEKGVTGRRVTVIRIAKEKGQIIHKDKIASYYKPKKAIVRMGTGEAAPAVETPHVAGTSTAPLAPSPEEAAQSQTNTEPMQENTDSQQSQN